MCFGGPVIHFGFTLKVRQRPNNARNEGQRHTRWRKMVVMGFSRVSAVLLIETKIESMIGVEVKYSDKNYTNRLMVLETFDEKFAKFLLNCVLVSLNSDETIQAKGLLAIKVRLRVLTQTHLIRRAIWCSPTRTYDPATCRLYCIKKCFYIVRYHQCCNIDRSGTHINAISLVIVSLSSVTRLQALSGKPCFFVALGRFNS